ncbi:MAG: serine protease [Candidatus Dadabacteria bacterium]|nr:serine protease [Candidatus Dadabacteria bacterium]MDE0519539.1 serine protease [Candidatus Dadabacteria bacterium]MDE0662831.1 serine protease [Candidatus Dadabacteria bacterium]MXZ49140.1 trypsin-like peptidase domain-containing protein [Candidatus Dadabacteria bacterium]
MLDRRFLPAFFVLAVMGLVSCVTGVTGERVDTPPELECDLTLTSQASAQGEYAREDYYPEVFISDFSRDYGNPVFPTELSEDYYDIARKVSRSVFEMEFKEKATNCTELVEAPLVRGTGWLIAPKYVVTAAHNIEDIERFQIICLNTFDGETIEAKVKVVYKHVPNDLAVLELEENVDAVPMKIADQRPGRNEVLMAIGQDREKSRGLGAWTVTAGPALKLESGYEDPPRILPRRISHALPTGKGMSGGPIFNIRGEVVSIVSAG